MTSDELIEKLFRGQCSEEELLEVLDIVKKQGETAKIDVMERLWEELDRYPGYEHMVSRERIYARVSSAIIADQKKGSTKNLKDRAVRHRLVQYATAAIVVLALSVAMWISTSGGDRSSEIIARSGEEVLNIELPDASTVELSPQSELVYSEHWDKSEERIVELKGRAFFKVKKYPSTNVKFKVVTSDMVAEVLGTSFSVNTVNNQTEVALEEGSVRLDLKESKEDVVMNVGDVYTYSLLTQKRTKHHLTQDNLTVWQDNIVTMKNVRLYEILQNIEDLYDVKIETEKEKMLRRVYTIGIPSDDFETTLSVLGEVIKLNVVEDNGQYIIR